MKLKTFTLRLDPETGEFDDRALVSFLEHREALAVYEHFFVHGGEPLWCVLVSFREPPRPGRNREKKQPKPDPRSELSEADRVVFDVLRRWRNERAKVEGKPAYVLLTNRQMAEIARQRPEDMAALTAISGVGEARSRDLGTDVLAVVAAAVQGGAADGPPQVASSGEGEGDGPV